MDSMRLLAVCCTPMTYCSITPGVLNENAKANESWNDSKGSDADWNDGKDGAPLNVLEEK